MNCKLLAIWTSSILILWILLLYIVNTDKIEFFTQTINTDPTILEYQMGELNKNYNSIDDLQSNLDTNTRKLHILNQQTNDLNKVAYVFKYITIISISLLILMICIFVLNFDHISGPSAVARSKASAFFKRLKIRRPKGII
jgi:predicted PurR-regulated permease PerM